MLTIDCHELTVDEQLALAAALSDGLEGKALALVKDESIVFDALSQTPPAEEEVETIVERFVSRRKGGEHYSLEVDDGVLIVHSADPQARARGRKGPGLPENLLKCPFCFFVTPYQEVYNIHVRAHGFAAPV